MIFRDPLARPLTLLLAGCLAAGGCAGLNGVGSRLNPFAKRPIHADAAHPAIEVACIWQPGEGRNDKGIPCRGFTGQVLFFDRTHSEPVLVDGTTRFYLFAERGDAGPSDKPLHQYEFTPDAWNVHATQTSLGPGYSVFIPYPEPEPYQTRCDLRLKFTPRLGPTLYSEAVTLTLEGPPRPGHPTPPATVKDANLDHRRIPANELIPVGDQAAADPSRRLRTDTFRMDGQVRPAAYTQPLSSTPPRRLPESDANATPLSHPLTGMTQPATVPGTDSSPRRFRLGGEAESATAAEAPAQTGSHPLLGP